MCAISFKVQLPILSPQLNLIPGKDYQILSVSFDERDTIQVAKEKKANYMMALNNSFPPEYWRFLTGDQNNIKKIMDAIGFKFRREGNDFIHGVVVVVVSPDGKIIRYIYGTRILPFDITMAITEAQKGLPGLSVKRVLNYCFSYDPVGKICFQYYESFRDYYNNSTCNDVFSAYIKR